MLRGYLFGWGYLLWLQILALSKLALRCWHAASILLQGLIDRGHQFGLLFRILTSPQNLLQRIIYTLRFDEVVISTINPCAYPSRRAFGWQLISMNVVFGILGQSRAGVPHFFRVKHLTTIYTVSLSFGRDSMILFLGQIWLQSGSLLALCC